MSDRPPSRSPRRFSELMFEKLQVPSLMPVKDAVLAAFAHNRTSAMVVDVGEEYARYDMG